MHNQMDKKMHFSNKYDNLYYLDLHLHQLDYILYYIIKYFLFLQLFLILLDMNLLFLYKYLNYLPLF